VGDNLTYSSALQVLLFALCTLFISRTLAQDTPDFSGVWEATEWATEPWPLVPPFTEAGQAAQDKWQANPEADPNQLCIIHLVRITSAPFPHEIIQQEQRITFLYEYQHQVRRVFLDGREHPKNAWPTLMGHSIGKIEGNTLTIDTVAVEAGYLRPQAFPHTENMHLIEKHTLLDGRTKEIQMIIDDPEYYKHPWGAVMTWSKIDEEILDYDCIVRGHVEPE